MIVNMWNCVFYLHLQPNAETDDSITPLLSAVAAGSLTCLDLLLKVPDFLPSSVQCILVICGFYVVFIIVAQFIHK